MRRPEEFIVMAEDSLTSIKTYRVSPKNVRLQEGNSADKRTFFGTPGTYISCKVRQETNF